MVASATTASAPEPGTAGSGKTGSFTTTMVRQSPTEYRRRLRPTAHPLDRIAETAHDTGAIISHLQQTEIYRDYQRAFENITGLPLALRQAGSFQPPLHGSKRLNPFCALMARRNNSCAACLRLQQRLEDGGMNEPRTFECFAGLQESVVPVRAGGKLLGYLQTGQVFLGPPTMRRFNKVMRETGETKTAAERQELKTAYFQTRIVVKNQYESILRLLTVFAKHLAVVSNQTVIRAAPAELPAMTKARIFIAEHHKEDMPLRDVARAVSMSIFYFCKIFKQTTKLTFTDYRARVRIESVKQMLLDPYTRVTEAAYAAGFQSLSQFNRAFQRVEGESPTLYRSRLHASPNRDRQCRLGGGDRGQSYETHD